MRLAALLLGFFFFLQSQNSIKVNSKTAFMNINTNLEFFEDPTANLSIIDIRSDRYSDLFKISNQEVLNFGRTSSVIWLRLKIESSETQNGFT
jgi:hypothetical protein